MGPRLREDNREGEEACAYSPAAFSRQVAPWGPSMTTTPSASSSPRMRSAVGQSLADRACQSNLCSEIMLHTGKDHLGKERTAVCCLSSVNAETFLEWRDEPRFIEDVMRFLDNVLEDFIQRAPVDAANAVYAAKRERSVGLGLMGFHSFL